VNARSLAACAALVFATAVAEGSTLEGRVFLDLDADGVRDEGEAGVAGVVVQRGAQLVRSDADGRYVLDGDEAGDALVWITRPDGFECEVWFRTGGGDFGLRARARDSGFFVHMSDAHVAERASDFGRHAVPDAIAAMPRWLAGQAMAIMLRNQHGGGVSNADLADAIQRARYGEGSERSASAAATIGDYVHALRALADDPSDPPMQVDPAGDFRASLGEIARLAPEFVVSTGDLALESNEVDAATAGEWLDFYRRETRATGLRFYETIGNNELVGIGRDEVDPSEPGFGKQTFRSRFGPTAYAFERAGVHFIALDTHRQDDADGDDWSFTQIDSDVRAWLEADLAAHAGRTMIVLNHEPFAHDPRWPFTLRLTPTVRASEWLASARVAYTLTGHLHTNGSAIERHRDHATLHVSTGALSGARWVFPREVAPRGYRLAQLRGGALYTAWKRTGEPLLAFASPPEAEAFATRPPDADDAAIVVVAADRDGPFAALELALGAEPLELEAWSPYFFAARIDPARLREARAAGGVLRATARRANGELVEHAHSLAR